MKKNKNMNETTNTPENTADLEYIFNNYIRATEKGKPNYRAAKQIKDMLEARELYLTKLSKKSKGKNIKMSKESREKSVQTLLKKIPSVLQIDKEGNIINEFESIRDVARKTNISRSNIASVLKGLLKTAGGFIWETKKKSDA